MLLINYFGVVLYPNIHKLTSAHLHKKGSDSDPFLFEDKLPKPLSLNFISFHNAALDFYEVNLFLLLGSPGVMLYKFSLISKRLTLSEDYRISYLRICGGLTMEVEFRKQFTILEFTVCGSTPPFPEDKTFPSMRTNIPFSED